MGAVIILITAFEKVGAIFKNEKWGQLSNNGFRSSSGDARDGGDENLIYIALSVTLVTAVTFLKKWAQYSYLCLPLYRTQFLPEVLLRRCFAYSRAKEVMAKSYHRSTVVQLCECDCFSFRPHC